MKVIRFVSNDESEKYFSGAELYNYSTHHGSKTTSVGFCFAEITPERDAEIWLRKLMFRTEAVWCIEFDTDKFLVPLKESKAFYADDNDLCMSVVFREWCTTEYSIDTHPYTRLGKCPSFIDLCRGKKIKWL